MFPSGALIVPTGYTASGNTYSMTCADNEKAKWFFAGTTTCLAKGACSLAESYCCKFNSKPSTAIVSNYACVAKALLMNTASPSVMTTFPYGNATTPNMLKWESTGTPLIAPVGYIQVPYSIASCSESSITMPVLNHKCDVVGDCGAKSPYCCKFTAFSVQLCIEQAWMIPVGKVAGDIVLG